MPVQVFVEARLAHAETWLVQGDLEARLRRLHEFADALPFRILDALGLSHHLAGTHGGGQFLLLIPEEFAGRTNELLEAAAGELLDITGVVRLIRGSTENLGGWVDIRRRLQGAMTASLLQPAMRTEALPLPIAEAAPEAPEALLRLEVDRVAARLGRAVSVEEYVELSRRYHEFVSARPAGVRVLAAGGHRIVAAGSLNGVMAAARECEQRFRVLTGTLTELAGNEGKTVSAAIETSAGDGDSAAGMYARAGHALRAAAASGGNVLRVFGRGVEWDAIPEIAAATERLVRLVGAGASRQFLYELAGFYRGSGDAARRSRGERIERPWRFHRRLAGLLGSADGARDRDYARLRNELLQSFAGRGAAEARLRPGGRVALEWAGRRTEER